MGCLLSACQDCFFPNHAWEHHPTRTKARLVPMTTSTHWRKMYHRGSGLVLPSNQPGADIRITNNQLGPTRLMTKAEVLDLATRVPWDCIIPRNERDAVRFIIKFKGKIPDSAVQRCAHVPTYFKARYRYMC